MTDVEVVEADEEMERPRAPVEFRHAAEFEVRHAERIIELVAVPYDAETVVEYPPGSGRLVRESVSRNAFAGVERRVGRRGNAVRANRDHDINRPCGIAISLRPSATQGLVAELKMSRTPLGDETLELADDGVLGASVGMAVLPSDQVWTENRSRRVIARAFLDHIAMCANPAYEGAEVIAVRTRDDVAAVVARVAATPNLDIVRGWMARDRYESLT